MPDTAQRSAVSPPPVDALRQVAAQLVTEALTSGNLRHPNRPEVALFLPGFNATAHPDPEVVDALNQLAEHLGEALIDTVLKGLDAELVRTADLEQLRTRAANAKPQLVTVICKQHNHRKLVQLAVKPGTNTAEIRCDRLRTHLAECEDG
jgi:hypothetical protein